MPNRKELTDFILASAIEDLNSLDENELLKEVERASRTASRRELIAFVMNGVTRELNNVPDQDVQTIAEEIKA